MYAYVVYKLFIYFSCVQGKSHFVLYFILHPSSDDLIIVKTCFSFVSYCQIN